jgi:hypothetical protein
MRTTSNYYKNAFDYYVNTLSAARAILVELYILHWTLIEPQGAHTRMVSIDRPQAWHPQYKIECRIRSVTSSGRARGRARTTRTPPTQTHTLYPKP